MTNLTRVPLSTRSILKNYIDELLRLYMSGLENIEILIWQRAKADFAKALM